MSVTVGSGQTVSGIILYGGEYLDVFYGGTACGTVVSSGGTLVVLPGSTVTGTVLKAGGVSHHHWHRGPAT